MQDPAHDPASSSSRSLFPLDDAVADVAVVAAGPVAVVWRPSSWVTVMMGSSGSSMGTCGDFPVELGKWLGGVGIVMTYSSTVLTPFKDVSYNPFEDDSYTQLKSIKDGCIHLSIYLPIF